MATAADLRRIALALPQVGEGSHRGMAAFRVDGKIMAMVGGARAVLFPRLGGGPPVAVVKLAREDQLNFCAALPEAVEETESYGRHGWTYVWLDRVGEADLATLLRLAWANVAPKRLVKAHATAR